LAFPVSGVCLSQEAMSHYLNTSAVSWFAR